MKTLLLDRVYQPVSFLSFRKMTKLLALEKVEVIAAWNNDFYYSDKLYPATLKLKDYVRRRPRTPRFNRKSLFRRDKFQCQYSGKVFPPALLTIDHVIPKDQGGKTTWENCVTASLEENSKKANRTPEQAGMVLLRKPTTPALALSLEYSVFNRFHEDWLAYFPELTAANIATKT